MQWQVWAKSSFPLYYGVANSDLMGILLILCSDMYEEITNYPIFEQQHSVEIMQQA
jgi:hypothetical protein